MAATQADVDALTQQVGQIASDLAAARTAIQTQLDALAAGQQGVDVTALETAIAPIDGAVVALGQLTPTPSGQ